uniref:Uncharacterized protein n=1 Tax=Aegilops tauschii subsp. strangulata TaxID=200361 RepID=A0A452ZVK4_AEGTS
MFAMITPPPPLFIFCLWIVQGLKETMTFTLSPHLVPIQETKILCYLGP